MSFKIGFSAETRENKNEAPQNIIPQKGGAVRRSVVDVFFEERHLTCSYYNDMFDLKRGDIVYVDGKLEGLRGRVVDVNYNFKIRLSDYKRVISLADTKVSGELFMAGSHFIAIEDGVIPFDKIVTWFRAPSPDDEEFISSSDDRAFDINNLKGLTLSGATAERGRDYYVENRVVYIEIKDGKGKAIVIGSKPYEVEFNYDNGLVSGLVCGCYCTGTCKHEFATLLQLRETIETVNREYGDGFDLDYLAIISKPTLYDYTLTPATKGSIRLN